MAFLKRSLFKFKQLPNRRYFIVSFAIGLSLCLTVVEVLAWEASRAAGLISDCFDNDAPLEWISDTVCHDGSILWENNPVFLNCPQWNFDGGDCLSGSTWIPVSGPPVPSMAALDIAIIDMMAINNISAGAIGVMKDGCADYLRFFGWSDESRVEPLLPNSMMRIASVTKPLMAACIRQIIGDGSIDLEDSVFDLGQEGGGLLDITPFSGIGDRRLVDITVDHCLKHRAGWDRDIAGDHTYREIQIKQDYGQDAPPNREQTLAWIMSQPLQFTPGTKKEYSNIGYLILGLIIEQYAGTNPLIFLYERILGPIGVLQEEVELGRSLPINRNSREPWYDNQGLQMSNVFATLDELSSNPDNHLVPAPDGGWYQEVRVGQGGLIATPEALLKYLNHYRIAGDDIGLIRDKDEESTSWSLYHTGSFKRGTNAIAQQWGDGYCFVALFNKRNTLGENYAITAKHIFRTLLNAGTITMPYQQGNCNCTECGVGDITCDGVVDMVDLAILAEHWLYETINSNDESTLGADINCDSAIDLFDLRLLAFHWLQ